MSDSIKDSIQKIDTLPWLISIRRHLHAHPELSFQEFKTAAFIAQELRALQVPFQEIASTGILVTIKGNHPTTRTIVLRADTDALPIEEANDVDYKSQNKGVMHACGHDVHTASMIGTVKILHMLRKHFEGTVRVIFQPAEEKNPGGALSMIASGVLSSPQPASILGQHVNPEIPVGKVGFVQGAMMASADELYITVRGRGGHAAHPHLAVDPIIIASHVVVALQQVISRYNNPTFPAVLSLCKIAGGHTTNVIPSEVQLSGTLRTTNEEWREEAHQKIAQVASGIAASMGGSCTLDIHKGYPCLHNDGTLTEKMKQAAKKYLSSKQVIDFPLCMEAEDFAYYTQQIPGCFYYLGVRNESKGITHLKHTSQFDVDEKSLEVGAGLMAWLAICELMENKK